MAKNVNVYQWFCLLQSMSKNIQNRGAFEETKKNTLHLYFDDDFKWYIQFTWLSCLVDNWTTIEFLKDDTERFFFLCCPFPRNTWILWVVNVNFQSNVCDFDRYGSPLSVKENCPSAILSFGGLDRAIIHRNKT